MIPDDVVAHLQYIELVTKKKIRNPIVGSHASVLKGHGYDFVEHKRYAPGDDLRRVDWNALARTGELLVKRTHEEREVDAFIVADLSRSMQLGSARYSKSELLLYVAAALGYSALADRIRVGLIGFSDAVDVEVAPQSGRAHLWTLLAALWEARSRAAATDLGPAVDALRRATRRLSMVFLVSDFLFDADIFDRPAFNVLATKHDVIPVVLSDPLESTLPRGGGYVRYRDLESGRERLVRLSARNRTAYAQWARDRQRALVGAFYRLNLDFVELDTTRPFQDLVAGLFLTRRRA